MSETIKIRFRDLAAIILERDIWSGEFRWQLSEDGKASTIDGKPFELVKSIPEEDSK